MHACHGALPEAQRSANALRSAVFSGSFCGAAPTCLAYPPLQFSRQRQPGLLPFVRSPLSPLAPLSACLGIGSLAEPILTPYLPSSSQRRSQARRRGEHFHVSISIARFRGVRESSSRFVVRGPYANALFTNKPTFARTRCVGHCSCAESRMASAHAPGRQQRHGSGLTDKLRRVRELGRPNVESSNLMCSTRRKAGSFQFGMGG